MYSEVIEQIPAGILLKILDNSSNRIVESEVSFFMSWCKHKYNITDYAVFLSIFTDFYEGKSEYHADAAQLLEDVKQTEFLVHLIRSYLILHRNSLLNTISSHAFNELLLVKGKLAKTCLRNIIIDRLYVTENTARCCLAEKIDWRDVTFEEFQKFIRIYAHTEDIHLQWLQVVVHSALYELDYVFTSGQRMAKWVLEHGVDDICLEELIIQGYNVLYDLKITGHYDNFTAQIEQLALLAHNIIAKEKL
jgi:hypothetical protein